MRAWEEQKEHAEDYAEGAQGTAQRDMGQQMGEGTFASDRFNREGSGDTGDPHHSADPASDLLAANMTDFNDADIVKQAHEDAQGVESFSQMPGEPGKPYTEDEPSLRYEEEPDEMRGL